MKMFEPPAEDRFDIDTTDTSPEHNAQVPARAVGLQPSLVLQAVKVYPRDVATRRIARLVGAV